LLYGCASQSVLEKKLQVKEWRELYRIHLSYQPEKCLYSFIKDTAYVMDKETAQIEIFRSGKKTNSIGGRGMDKLSFNSLSDIALAMDGTIFALDSFQKKIKRFDENGGFVSQMEISEIAYPTLFDVASDETFYLYDEDRNEIAIVRKGSKIEHFGKFVLQKPMFLLVKNNFITIYDEATGKTLFFSTFGKLLDERNGFVMRENQVDFQLRSNFIQPVNSETMFAVSPETWNSFLIKHNAAVLLSEKGILVGRFFYETQH
jgi:hypothetical protein